jgi:chromosome segregation ATPase
MKVYDESSISSSESMGDLRRELSRFKDIETYSSKYIIDLEARLSRADESILGLQQTVEKLEKESERRRDEVETLQGRLELFKQDGENWRSDLEARELKIKLLEEKMREWEQRRKDAGETRARLGSVVGEVESARKTLQIDFENTPSGSASPAVSDSAHSPIKLHVDDPVSSSNVELESQLLSLQQTHTATLADLSSVSSKYRDALREISDLAAQIQEAKLNSPSLGEVTTDSPATDSPATDKLSENIPFKRRINSPRIRESPDAQLNAAGRRLFFRQAASAESLHAR